jgi:Mrp family chromosome partitioning ATPase
MMSEESYEVKISIGFHCTKSSCNLEGPMASTLNQMILMQIGIEDFMLVDLPPGTGDIHLNCAGFANNGSGSS